MRASLILLSLLFVCFGQSRRLQNVQNNLSDDDFWDSTPNDSNDYVTDHIVTDNYTEVYGYTDQLVQVYSDESMKPKLRFYHDSFDNFTESDFEFASKIFSTGWYNAEKATVIFAHGFTGFPYGVAVTGVMKTHLEEGKYNCILLNWDKMAASTLSNHANSYLNWATPNSIKIAFDFVDVLIKLANDGLDLNRLHLIGHSLGAHMFGIVGYKMAEKGHRLPWITGLDPARIGFERKPVNMRISPESARFVAVIHTDPYKYGSRRELGHVDFWPNFRNGPVFQPGCSNQGHPRFSPEDLCNHHRCWKLLIDAMKYPGTLMGSWAKNFRSWKNYSNQDRNANVLELGLFSPNATHGNYYFTTVDKSPYGLGKDGL